MKAPWIISILILCMACGNPQSVEQKKQDPVPDTTRRQILTDSPASAPGEVKKDTATGLHGPTLVFTTDLNYDSIPDTISLRTLAGDTSSYDNITVSIVRYGKQSFTSASNWSRVDDDFRGARENAYPTNHFFLAKNGVETLLVLFGFVGEGPRDQFSIIRIKDNMPRMVFDQDHWHDDIEVVDFIRDMDNDGTFELGYDHLTEGENTNPEEIGGILTRYSPTMVYTVDDSLVLNKPVMKKWNEENYVFAGYEGTDAIKVFWPNDRTKKCRLWKGKMN